MYYRGLLRELLKAVRTPNAIHPIAFRRPWLSVSSTPGSAVITGITSLAIDPIAFCGPRLYIAGTPGGTYTNIRNIPARVTSLAIHPIAFRGP